jgi:DnaK suppressor protein
MPRDEWDEADARGEVAPRFSQGTAGAWHAAESLAPGRAAQVRAALEARAAQLDTDLADLERLERPPDGGSRPQYGKRIGDHTSDALETRRNVAAADTLRGQRAEVTRALAKLDEGSYGRCDGCGQPIGDDRLEALPWAAECVACRAKPARR